MTSQGHPSTIFRRALAARNGTEALSAAYELGRLQLPDSLAVTLLILPQREIFERCAARWVGRFVVDVRGIRIQDAALAASALSAMRVGSLAGAEALLRLFAELGRNDLANVVEDWIEGVALG